MLHGEKVKLTPLEREHIELFLKWFNDPEITQYLLMYRPLTRDMEEEWFKGLKNREDFIIFSIVVPEENERGKLIGNCGITIDWKNRVGICGITIGEKDFHGKGYGTEAMKLLVEYGFKTLNLNRMQLETYEFNTRALKSYQKVGFIEEGLRRKAIYINGSYHDCIMLGLLRSEWENKI
jgi:RimJ/RimL family protein N-acetyltransferase